MPVSRPYPLGATWDGAGVNFALFSQHATGVDLCFFDGREATRESSRIPVVDRTDGVWHVYVPGARPGQVYGYRVSGPWAPADGFRFNPAALLLDPYAKAIARPVTWHDALLGRPAPTDTAPFAPLAAVVDPAFDWGDDRRPGVPWHETVIYELHVKGFTARHPQIDPALRGTYRGLATEPAIRHLVSLGVTTVELLPIHQHADEPSLVERGLVNYWGYNTLGFFAPDVRFACSDDPLDAVREFKSMVRALHAAGLEVILDVVYNHTAEGDHTGPTLSWRGIDNPTYYRLDPEARARYADVTGCGNTVNAADGRTLQMIMDSLRYWVEEMHVDGFRFDLASALARDARGFDRGAPFLAAVTQDPVLARVKRIAEPWDAGEGGYQVGNFPPGWSEWNDRYRNAVRRFWRGDAGALPDLATRLAGSSDLYAPAGRGPDASLNYVTSHDGFTLADLVAYANKHNDANLEDNRDGEAHNISWNSGVEGQTADADVRALRRRQRLNLLLTLFVSQGVPMVSGGDEFGRTQHGNNNAYCHDSALSWTPWPDDDEARGVLAFVGRLAAVRRAQPALRRRRFLVGGDSDATEAHWLRPEGGVFEAEDWADHGRHAIGLLLDSGAAGAAPDGATPGDTLLVLLNASAEEIAFVMPAHRQAPIWERLADTADPYGPAHHARPGATWTLPPQAAAIFRGSSAEAPTRP